MAGSNRWKNGGFLHFKFDGWLCSYWPSYLHCQHARFDGYNPQLPALSHSRVHCDNCLLWMDRECLSEGTSILSLHATAVKSPLVLTRMSLRCILSVWAWGPWACPLYVASMSHNRKMFSGPSRQTGQGRKRSYPVQFMAKSFYLPATQTFPLFTSLGEKFCRHNCLRIGGSSDSSPQPVK
jgi:hypothetical protein